MNNPLMAEYEVVIDGVRRTLRFDLAAFAALQQATGAKTFHEMLQLDLTSPKMLPMTLAAGLQHGFECTPEQIAHADISIIPATAVAIKALSVGLWGMEGKPESPLVAAAEGESGIGANA